MGGGDAHRGVTIAQIAAAAGVSVPTISRVLNGRAGVSAEKREEIERLLVEHGTSAAPDTSAAA